MSYQVRAHGWTHGLVLHILGVGWTQTHDAHPDVTPEMMVRDYLACEGRADAQTADVVIVRDDDGAMEVIDRS